MHCNRKALTELTKQCNDQRTKRMYTYENDELNLIEVKAEEDCEDLLQTTVVIDNLKENEVTSYENNYFSSDTFRDDIVSLDENRYERIFERTKIKGELKEKLMGWVCKFAIKFDALKALLLILEENERCCNSEQPVAKKRKSGFSPVSNQFTPRVVTELNLQEDGCQENERNGWEKWLGLPASKANDVGTVTLENRATNPSPSPAPLSPAPPCDLGPLSPPTLTALPSVDSELERVKEDAELQKQATSRVEAKLDRVMEMVMAMTEGSFAARISQNVSHFFDQLPMSQLPTATLEQFENLEAQLEQDPTLKTRLVGSFLSSARDTEKSSAAGIMRRIMSDNVAENFSLTGKLHPGAQVKKPFIKTQLYKVVYETCITSNSLFKESLVRQGISDWLMQAKFRRMKRDVLVKYFDAGKTESDERNMIFDTYAKAVAAKEKILQEISDLERFEIGTERKKRKYKRLSYYASEDSMSSDDDMADLQSETDGGTIKKQRIVEDGVSLPPELQPIISTTSRCTAFLMSPSLPSIGQVPSNDNLLNVLRELKEIKEEIVTWNNSLNELNTRERVVHQKEFTTKNTFQDELNTERTVLKDMLNSIEETVLRNRVDVSAILKILKSEPKGSESTDHGTGSIVSDFENRLPMRVLADFFELENTLSNNRQKSEEFMSYLGNVGGVGMEDNVKRILVRLFTNEVAREFSWEGSRGKKVRLLDTLLVELIRGVVRMKHSETFELKAFENKMSEWFRQAGTRIHNKQMNKSVQENN